MTRTHSLIRSTALIGLAMAMAVPAAAQEVVPPPTPNADRLAEQMRVLARDPRNVRALLAAGEYSARLNDPSAAAGFFARAQAFDPGNPRLFAGQAMVMVRMERPGEALRLFGEAERRGLSMDAYASDRGLAYDLIGAQTHALRDHRIAMRGAGGIGPDDETIRRYALSLGISGRTAEAMTALDPLLRRTDRASWRARAFILAMNGDAAGADKIAASMMGGFGSALSPFFRRLPTLTAADKAFAVHFGELRQTTARIADAQAAPPLPRIAAEPGVAVASVQLPSASVSRRERQTTQREAGGRGAAARQREREDRDREQLAARQAEAQRVAETRRQADLKAQRDREALAARQREAENTAAQQQAARDAETRRVADLQARERAATELAAREAETRRFAEAQRLAEAQRATEAQRAAEARSVADVQTAVVPQPQPEQPAPVLEPVARASVPTPAFETPATPPAAPPVLVAAAPLPAAPGQAPATMRVGGEDNVIARIIAGITIPASELGVEPMPGREPPAAPEPEPVRVAQASTPPPAPVEIAKAPPPKPAVAKPKPDPAVAANAKAAQLKAAEAKAEKAKAAAEARAAAAKLKADPPRHWAQVAGGANVGALPREWARLVKEAPAEFRGRQAWTTPLRFTNRLLVGPFKTPGEAQTFVNLIRKKGLTGFSWSSEAGQKIERLGVK